MNGLLICVGLVFLLLFLYMAGRLVGLGWFTSMKEVIKSKTRKGV